MATLRFGVIGWGLRSGLGRTLAAMGHTLVALADPSPDAQAKFRENFPEAAVFDDYRSLLDLAPTLDAVLVLSPDWLHEEHGLALLEAGIAVYLEKPMAITTEGCDRLLAAAQRTGAKLYVGHNMRHFAVVRAMKDWIGKGMIGEVKTAWCRHFVSYGGEAYFRDWHADRTKSTGLLLQKGAHDIDVLHWLCGGFSRRVVAMGAGMLYPHLPDRAAPGERVPTEFTDVWPPAALTKLYPVIDVEDVSLMLMELDNGVLASYHQCHFAPDAWRNYTVIGTEGRIENFGDAPGAATVRLWQRNHMGYSERADLEYHVPPAEGGRGSGHGGSDGRILGEFVRYVTEGGETDATALAARQAVAAGVAATHSLRNGNIPVEIPGV